MTEGDERRPRWQPADAWALGVVVVTVLVGALWRPVEHLLDPLEAMRARWRDDRALLDRLSASTGAPLWSDGQGGALPPGYPNNLGAADPARAAVLLEEKLGGRLGPSWHPWQAPEGPAPDERHPALPTVPPDVWGHPYWLTVSWRARRWALVSSGPDGRIATPDDLELFAWRLRSWGMFWPPRVGLLLCAGAGLFAWLYLVLRALWLPRVALPWEAARAAVLVTPLLAVSSCCLAGAGPRALATWSELQVAPAWLSVSLTVCGCAAGAIVWRRTRPPAGRLSSSERSSR